MRSSRTARKIVGAVAAGAVSALLLGGVAAVTADDTAGHGIKNKRGGSYSAGHGVRSAVSTDGHGVAS